MLVLLGVFVFSRIKLSQGAPYTITTLLTYFISSNELALLGHFQHWECRGRNCSGYFAALSVGLGFGLQKFLQILFLVLLSCLNLSVRIGDTITIGEYSVQFQNSYSCNPHWLIMMVGSDCSE